MNFGMLGRLLALTKRGVSGSTPVIPTAGRGCGHPDARSLSSSLTPPGSTSTPRCIDILAASPWNRYFPQAPTEDKP
jgi:hypothetical protein